MQFGNEINHHRSDVFQPLMMYSRYRTRIRWMSKRRWDRIRQLCRTTSVFKLALQRKASSASSTATPSRKSSTASGEGSSRMPRSARAQSVTREKYARYLVQNELFTTEQVSNKLREAMNSSETKQSTTAGAAFHCLLNHSGGRQSFAQFLESEYADENLLFWVACQEFKAEERLRLRRRMGREIYDTFIITQSPLEINVNSECRRAVLSQVLADGEAKAFGNSGLFDSCQVHIYKLMEKDSFPRYLRSAFIQQFLLPISTACS